MKKESESRAEQKGYLSKLLSSTRTVWMFPIISSLCLLSAYGLIKSSMNVYVEKVIMLFLGYTGTTQLALYIRALFMKAGLEKLDSPVPLLENIRFKFFTFRLSFLSLLSLLIAGFITLKYIYSGNWMFNNLLAISFSVYFVNQMIVSSFLNGVVYLVGMLMYDVVWVFFSDVMATVAQELALPIKLLFPLQQNSVNITFYVLGIGDIILPAIFISLMLRFDFLREVTSQKLSLANFDLLKSSLNFPQPYFMASLVSYGVGMLATVLTY